MEFIQAKIYFYVDGNEATDIRRINLPSDISFNNFVELLKSQQTWVDVSNPMVEFKYLDQEQDWIVFKSQQEWNVCLETAQTYEMVIRVAVTKKSLPASDKVISFVKGFNLGGIWSSVVSNVSSLQPIVNSLANGLCHPPTYDEVVAEQPKPQVTVVEKEDIQLMDLSFVDDAFFQEVNENSKLLDSFQERRDDEECESYDDFDSSVAPLYQTEGFNKLPDEDSFVSEETRSEYSDDDEESTLSEEESEDEEEFVPPQVEVPPEYATTFKQIVDMGFENNREKIIEYLIEFKGDAHSVITQLLEQ